jgi:hypothetical protein
MLARIGGRHGRIWKHLRSAPRYETANLAQALAAGFRASGAHTNGVGHDGASLKRGEEAAGARKNHDFARIKATACPPLSGCASRLQAGSGVPGNAWRDSNSSGHTRKTTKSRCRLFARIINPLGRRAACSDVWCPRCRPARPVHPCERILWRHHIFRHFRLSDNEHIASSRRISSTLLCRVGCS